MTMYTAYQNKGLNSDTNIKYVQCYVMSVFTTACHKATISADTADLTEGRAAEHFIL